jgi:hypothetical protein
LDYKWTPAEANQILFRNFENPQQAVDELVTLTRDQLYGFQEQQATLTTLGDVEQ